MSSPPVARTEAEKVLPQAGLAALRARVRAIEGGGADPHREVARLGPAIDRDLPWRGLPSGALHEVGGQAATGVAVGFARRFLERRGALVWVTDERTLRARGELYAPALDAYGLDPGRLLYVRARNAREAAWAAAEALRSTAVACTVLEAEAMDLVSSRKLQLAAETGGGAGLILRGELPDPTPNAALTRFAAALPLDGMGPGCRATTARPVRLVLWRAKGAPPASWTVTWNERTLAFDLSPGMADRAGEARRRAAW